MNETVVYRPGSALRDPGRLMRELWRDARASRELAWRLFLRDVNARYRQTILGYLWFFVPPIVAAGPFIFLNRQGILNVGATDVPYVVFALVGTTVWQSFVEAVNSPLRVITSAKEVIAKVNLPREALLLSSLYLALFGLVVRLVLLAGVMVAWSTQPAVTAPLALFGMLALVLLGFMIGVLITPIGILYSDVTNALPMATTFLMFLTPVIYPVPKDGPAATLAAWNPLTPLVTSTRDWLLMGSSAYGWQTVIITAVTLALLFIGWIVIRVAMPHLIARLGN